MKTAIILLLGAMAIAATAPEDFNYVAGEGEVFQVSTSVLVRFGAGNQWIKQRVVGTVRCDAATFTDPAPGVAKTCETATQNRAPGVAQLTWDASPDPRVAEYRVYMKTATSDFSTGWSVGKQTKMGVTGLPRGETYSFCVKAFDSSGEGSDCSNLASKSIP